MVEIVHLGDKALISLVTGLIQNTALLLAMMVVFDLVTSRKSVLGEYGRRALAGVFLGVLCIGVMSTSFNIETGIIIDTRSVLLSVSGLFLGALPTAFAMVIAALFRIWQGGVGTGTGILVIFATGGLGILWRYFLRGSLKDISVPSLYLFGFTVHLVMLVLMLTLPAESAWRILSRISIPVLLIYPIATIVLGKLMTNRLQRESVNAVLATNEALYRSLFEAENVGKSVTQPTGELEVNGAFCKMLGYSREELRGKTWQELTPPEDVPGIEKRIAPMLAGLEDSTRFEKRYRHKDGSTVWGDVHVTLLRDSHGQPLHFITTVVEVTEQKEAERGLVASEKRYRSLFENMNAGFVLFEVVEDAQGRPIDLVVLAANERFEEATGLRVEQVVGKRLTEFLPGIEKDEADWIGTYSKVALTGEPKTFEQGSELLGCFYSVTAFQAGPRQCAVTFSDITDRKMMMEQLVEAKDKAEKNDKLKTAFINNISHEIRTPLNGILGFGQLLADPDLSAEERKEMFDCVQKSSDRLLNTISDYMDMAMIVSGTVDVQKRAFSLGSLFDGLSVEANQLCAEKKLGFRTAVPSDLADMELISDLELLKKILWKLIDNAVKFTREGGIVCGCSLKAGQVEFFVKDTGCGIDSSKLELMFQSFNQSETSYNRGYEGSGLGLPIARGLTTLLGGEIWGTSEKGTGSEFFFKIPTSTGCSPASSVKRRASRGKSPGNSLILIAEDDDLAFRYLKKLLLPMGSVILHASDGKEAVDCCRANPDISMVLMDIKMPVMDGLEATQEIRKFRPTLPIIATTAYAQTGDEQSFLAGGCDGYIAKPFNREKLFSVIESHNPRNFL